MSTSPYDAYVSTDGKADYTLPSLALAAGKKNIFIQPGVYLETGNVVVPDGAALTGALRGQCIIDFKGNDAHVDCTSSFGTVQTAGTISVTKGSTTVTGDSTTFTSLPSGTCYLVLNGRTFLIASIVSNTELTLSRAYNGNSLTAVNYQALKLNSFNSIKNVSIRDSSTYGLYISGCRKCEVSHVNIEGCGVANLFLENVYESNFSSFEVDFSEADGVVVNGSSTCTFDNAKALSNVECGIKCDGNCSFLLFSKINAMGNGSANISLNGDNCALMLAVAMNSSEGCLVNGSLTKVCGCSFTFNNINLHASSTCSNLLFCDVNVNDAGSQLFYDETSNSQYGIAYP